MGEKCNVCIIGAGPAGLSALSALKEPYTLDTMTAGQIQQVARFLNRSPNPKVCVVDPGSSWMESWDKSFETLGIEYLRSPTLAHPDHFDKNALLAFAVEHGRENELLESGCSDISSLFSLGQSQVGLWKLPSTKLFRDFCTTTASRLKHDFIQSQVVGIKRPGPALFQIALSTGETIQADSVVLALGAVGHPVIPKALRLVPPDNIFQWKALDTKLSESHQRILVVGGGLTAVQVAQRAIGQGKSVVLCSRRPLVERHFDIGLDWFDERIANQRLSTFYHQAVEKRLSILKETRGGGSVPCFYRRSILQSEKEGKLSLIVGKPAYMFSSEAGLVYVSIESKIYKFDAIVLACGVKPNCLRHPLVRRIHKQWPIPIVGGFPAISEDLVWTDGLFVVGGLGSLNIGPDAGNIMGMKRAATLVANALQSRTWLRETYVLGNRFDALMEEDEEDDDDSSEDEEKKVADE